MIQIANASVESLSSRCLLMASLKHQTLNECKEEALEIQGNVINFRKHHCSIRRCDVEDYELTETNDPWDVYFIRGALKLN